MAAVFLNRLIDFFTLGSERPMRRLLAYYFVLSVVTVALLYFLPVANMLFSGERLDQLTTTPQMLRDGLAGTQLEGPAAELAPRLALTISAALSLLGTLVLMLPVSWVYMSTRRSKGHNQAIVQTLIILPIVVAGIVLVVRNSLALAFSLAGVVAAVRFRTTLNDARDVVFIFLAIAVGFAAGVQVMTVAALVSVIFNFVILFTWRYDFGRNVLEPSAAAAEWAEPLAELATQSGEAKVPDRDLVMALSSKKLEALADRFERVREMGTAGKKLRYNAIVEITTDHISEVQQQVELVLDDTVKRWKLDEVVTNNGKPSELYYLVRLRKSVGKDQVLTAIRAAAGDKIKEADVELGIELVKDKV